MTGEGRIGRKAGPALRLFRRAARGLSTEFRNYADVLIWTGHGDTETQRRSTRAACTAGRAVRRADRKRTTEPPSIGRSLRLARLARRCAAPRRARYLQRVLLCVFVFSVAKYVVVFLKWGTDRRHEIRRHNCEIEYLVVIEPTVAGENRLSAFVVIAPGLRCNQRIRRGDIHRLREIESLHRLAAEGLELGE